MIFWTGAGILVIPLGVVTLLVAMYGAEIITGQQGYAVTHQWVHPSVMLMGGVLCWFIGRALYRRGTRTLIDEGTGRRIKMKPSHTLFFIPFHWWSLAFVLAAQMSSLDSRALDPQSARERREKKRQEQSVADLERIIGGVEADQKSYEEAKKEAVRRFPALGVAGSSFNQEYVSRYQRYQKEKPGFFKAMNWPIVLAEETDAALKPSARPETK